MAGAMVTAPSARRPSVLLLTLTAALLVFVAVKPRARACGAFFPATPETNARIDAQRAFYVIGPTQVSLHLQLRPAADAGASFAWVFPVPATGDALPTLALGDTGLFPALDTMTRPEVTIVRDDGGGGGFGCGDAKSGDLSPGDRGAPVTHFGGGTLGPYTWDVLAGSDADAVAAWLEEAGYVVPDGLGAALAPYTEGSRFVAVRLTAPSEATEDALDPLVITYARPLSQTLLYPLALSALSSPDRAPFTIWTLADRRYRILNQGSVDISRVARVMADEGLGYNAAIAWLAEGADGRLTVTEYARDLAPLAAGLPPAIGALLTDDTHYLTRLFGEPETAALEDLYLTFAPNAPEVSPEVIITAKADGLDVGRHAGGPLLLLAGLVALRLRRRASAPT